MVENYQEMLDRESNGFIRHNGIRIVRSTKRKACSKRRLPTQAAMSGAAYTAAFSMQWRTPPRARSRASNMPAQRDTQRYDQLPPPDNAFQIAHRGWPRGEGRRPHWLFRGRYHRRLRCTHRPRRGEYVLFGSLNRQKPHSACSGMPAFFLLSFPSVSLSGRLSSGLAR